MAYNKISWALSSPTCSINTHLGLVETACMYFPPQPTTAAGITLVVAAALLTSPAQASAPGPATNVATPEATQLPRLVSTFEPTPTVTGLNCWRKAQRGDVTANLRLTDEAFDGQYSGSFEAPVLSNGWAKMMQDYWRKDCTLPATAGKKYSFSAWHKVSGDAVVTAYRQDGTGKWNWWQQSPRLRATSSWTKLDFVTKAAPADTQAVSFAITMYSPGSVKIDNVITKQVLPELDPENSLVRVETSAQLRSALAEAKPGTHIQLADGIYDGPFKITRSGTRSAPIKISGSRGAILRGKGVSSGYVLHLDRANWVVLEGFQAQRAKKVIVLDESSHNLIYNLDIGYAGEELVLMRNYSSHNTITKSYIHRSGLVTPGYGEGVYIGLSKSNWSKESQSRTGGLPDRSDYNTVKYNYIEKTTAECIDIKEGTTGGLISGNRLLGNAMSGENYADSWVDVQGNGYRIQYNHGTRNGGNIKDGFQTHVRLPGWGVDNTFAHNHGTIEADGYGIYIHKRMGNTVEDNNTFSYARSGTSNAS